MKQLILGIRQRKAFARSERIMVKELVVLNRLSGGLPAESIEQLRRALELLGEDPRAARRLRTAVRRIFVREGAVSGFLDPTRTVVLGHDLLAQSSPPEIASVIVHESIHARIHAFGVQPRADRRDRVERLCLNAQIEFLERIPGTERVITHLKGFVGKRWW